MCMYTCFCHFQRKITILQYFNMLQKRKNIKTALSLIGRPPFARRALRLAEQSRERLKRLSARPYFTYLCVFLFLYFKYFLQNKFLIDTRAQINSFKEQQNKTKQTPFPFISADPSLRSHLTPQYIQTPDGARFACSLPLYRILRQFTFSSC